MLDGFCGAGSGLCLAEHQLSWAVLTHFTCQHSRRFLPCNQKHGRDSLFCQQTPCSAMKSSSGVGGNTKEWPWLLITPGCFKDLKSISKASVHKVIYLQQLLFAPLEQWLHPSLAEFSLVDGNRQMWQGALQGSVRAQSIHMLWEGRTKR